MKYKILNLYAYLFAYININSYIYVFFREMKKLGFFPLPTEATYFFLVAQPIVITKITI